MSMLRIKIYDNGGKTIDRYTMIMPDGEAWGFNENPYHPQGFGQYAGSLAGLHTFSHLGKPVKSVMDLPEQARRFVDEVATADGATYVVGSGSGRTKKPAKRKSTRSRSQGTSIRGIRG